MPDCYKCIYRGTIPGDAHSCCNHPKVTQDSNVFGALMDMIAGKSMGATRELGIKASPYGVRSGWFMWPVSFDPVWLISCNGFTAKDSP